MAGCWKLCQQLQSNYITVLNIANIGSTGLKNYSPVKSNSSGSLSRCPQHRFPSSKAQGLNSPLTMGHFAFRLQTKIKFQVEKLLEPQRIEFWPLLKICVRSYRTQADSDASFTMISTVKPKMGSVEMRHQVLRGLHWATVMSAFSIYKCSFKAQNYILNSTEGCRRFGHPETTACV